MIIGALIDLGLNINFLKNELKKLNVKGYEIKSKKIVKNNIAATKFYVVKNKNLNEERSLKEINQIIDNSKLDGEIKN